MNKQSLNMEFPEDLLQQTLTQEIVLSNPGTAPAEFLWGSAGAFMCSPEKGSIGPGKSTVISITWTPQAGKRNEEVKIDIIHISHENLTICTECRS